MMNTDCSFTTAAGFKLVFESLGKSQETKYLGIIFFSGNLHKILDNYGMTG